LGIVSGVSGQAWWQGKDLGSMFPDMKSEVCKLGADALIIKNVEAGGVVWIQNTRVKPARSPLKLYRTKSRFFFGVKECLSFF